MNTRFFLMHSFGFALQVIPPTLLMLLPFTQAAFRLRRGVTWILFILSGVGMSVAFSILMCADQSASAPGFLDGYGLANTLMCAAIVLVTCAFFLLLRAPWSHRLLVLFSAICFAAIQYSLANIILMFMPAGESSGQVYDRNTVIAFALATALLLPFFIIFFRTQLRRYLQQTGVEYSTRDLAFLSVLTALYLGINAVTASFWNTLRDVTSVNDLYYPLVFLMLTAMLVSVYYYTVRLSNLRQEGELRRQEAAIIQKNYELILRQIQAHRKALHDSRHLLTALSAMVQNSSREELRKYIDEALEQTRTSDDRFCADPCVNGILQYYASIAAAAKLPFTSEARLTDLSAFRNTDLTVLLCNVLENAIRAAQELRDEDPDCTEGVRFIADEDRNLLRVRVDNACARVRFANPARTEGFLPGAAFLSTTSGGEGLGRIDAVCARYDGSASYRYDPETRCFTTRITLVMPDGSKKRTGITIHQKS